MRSLQYINQLEEAAKAIEYCTLALESEANDKDLLCDRAEAHILNTFAPVHPSLPHLRSLLLARTRLHPGHTKITHPHTYIALSF